MNTQLKQQVLAYQNVLEFFAGRVFQYALEFFAGRVKTDINDSRFQDIINVLKNTSVGDNVYVIEHIPEYMSVPLKHLYCGVITVKDDKDFTIECDDDTIFDLDINLLNINNSQILVIPALT